MIKNTEFKIYDIDNDWNKYGDPIRNDFSNMIIDKIKNITITFVNGTQTKINTVQSFEYDSEFNIVITDALFNATLYNAFNRNLEIKKVELCGIIADCESNCREYYFETEFENLKISRYNGGIDTDGSFSHEYTLVDINEEL